MLVEGEEDGTGDGAVVDASTEEDGAVFIEADDGVAGEAGTEAAEGVLSTTALVATVRRIASSTRHKADEVGSPGPIGGGPYPLGALVAGKLSKHVVTFPSEFVVESIFLVSPSLIIKSSPVSKGPGPSSSVFSSVSIGLRNVLHFPTCSPYSSIPS